MARTSGGTRPVDPVYLAEAIRLHQLGWLERAGQTLTAAESTALAPADLDRREPVALTRGNPLGESCDAMSEDRNVAVVRRWTELFNDRSDVAEFLSLLAADVEMRTPRGPHLRGHDEARAWFEERYENVRPRIVPDRFIVHGDTVVALGRTEVRWIGSDEVVEASESAAVYWLRDGKVSGWQPFGSHAAALEAAEFEQ